MAHSHQAVDTEAAISDITGSDVTDEKLQTETTTPDTPTNVQLSRGRKIMLAGVLVATYFLSVSLPFVYLTCVLKPHPSQQRPHRRCSSYPAWRQIYILQSWQCSG